MLAARTQVAVDLMTAFADRTGLGSGRSPHRYLWTDAFAVCNYLSLAVVTGELRYTELALRLVDQVHRVLGRHRPDDARTGWISGLDDQKAAAHPTRGGLRIGKRLAERGPGEPFDEQREWDRDGQYFHYLTKWMHALDAVACATGQPLFNAWARELAETAHRSFTYPTPHGTRMVWKASIDLSRAQVPSMGQHDPVDGLVTCAELEATARRLGADGPSLAAARADFAGMIDRRRLATDDPLGIGGLLTDAWRVDQLQRRGDWPAGDDLRDVLLEAAQVGLGRWVTRPELRASAGHRLAFRELGLAIGLAAVARLDGLPAGLTRFTGLGRDLVDFWLSPDHRETLAWLDHQDINDVMLATALLPDAFPGVG